MLRLPVGGEWLDGARFANDMRVCQLTPPGSACSIVIGAGIIDLVVDDIHAARAELVERGVDVGEVEDMGAPGKPTVSYARFSDPDGNSWTLQKLPY